MRKTINIAMLVLALSCFTYAGDIQNGVTGKTEGEIQNGVYGDMPNGGDIPNGTPGEMPNGEAGTSSQTSIDGLEVTFNLMQSLLGLF